MVEIAIVATRLLQYVGAAILFGSSLFLVYALPAGRQPSSRFRPLLIIGAACIPLGLWIFNRGEVYAKRRGKLKRSG